MPELSDRPETIILSPKKKNGANGANWAEPETLSLDKDTAVEALSDANIGVRSGSENGGRILVGGISSHQVAKAVGIMEEKFGKWYDVMVR